MGSRREEGRRHGILPRPIEEWQVKRVGGWFTTAFTDKPVSMKYRGICRLLTRKEGRLNYAAEMDIPIEDVGRIWWERYERSARVRSMTERNKK